MNTKHHKTLQEIFKDPVSSTVAWTNIEALFVALGAIIKEKAGSRVGIYLNGQVAVFHCPHPQKETDKGALKSVRKFLQQAGVTA